MDIAPDHNPIIAFILAPEFSPSAKSSLPQSEKLAKIVKEALVQGNLAIPAESLRTLGTRLELLDHGAFQSVQELLGICVSASSGEVGARVELALRRYEATQDHDVFQDLFAAEPPISLEDFKAALKKSSISLLGMELIHNEDGHLLALHEAASSQEGLKEIMFSGSQLSNFERLTPKGLANIINRQGLDLKGSALSKSALEEVAPHLTYCKLSKLNEDLQAELLAKLNPLKIHKLYLKSDEIQADQLPDLPFCQKLVCSQCRGLTKLPKLPQCQELDCWGCSALKTLPELPLCQKLDCLQCNELTELPELPQCQKLVCEDCTGLKEMHGLPLCRKLNCKRCSSLSGLPPLPKCEELECLQCIALRALPELPLCRRLACNKCTGLTALPESLPSCTYLSYRNCPGLDDVLLPELPLEARVFCSNAEAHSSWKVPYQKVEQNPKEFLDQLGQDYLLARKPFPSVHYLEPDDQPSEAVDVGGVRRDLLSRILRNLFQDTQEDGHLLRKDGFPLFKEGDEVSFQTLGKVLSLCYQPSTSFTTGALFHEEVYRALAASDHPLRKAIAVQILQPKLEQILEENFNVESSVRDQARIFVDEDYENDALSTPEGFRDYFSVEVHRENLRAEILKRLEEYPFTERHQAIELIASSMRAALGETAWEEMCRLGPSELKARIEGKLSAEAIWESLTWKTGNASQNEIESTAGYVKSWLEHADGEQLRLFVRAITSNNSLPVRGKITVELYQRGSENIPIAHTCFSTLELSAQYQDQENFNERLAYLIGQAEKGFQIH